MPTLVLAASVSLLGCINDLVSGSGEDRLLGIAPQVVLRKEKEGWADGWGVAIFDTEFYDLGANTVIALDMTVGAREMLGEPNGVRDARYIAIGVGLGWERDSVMLTIGIGGIAYVAEGDSLWDADSWLIDTYAACGVYRRWTASNGRDRYAVGIRAEVLGFGDISFGPTTAISF